MLVKRKIESNLRQLYLQAEMMEMINGNIDLFNKVRLVVSEGIYKAGPTETLSGDTLLKSKGELVYYQVIGNDGSVDLETTFDVRVLEKIMQTMMNFVWIMTLTIQTILLLNRLVSKCNGR